MFARIPRKETHLRARARQAAARLRRLAAVLAAATRALAASTALVPAAWAVNVIPNDGEPPVAPAVRVVSEGGTAGWQITLIALGAALVAATTTVLLDRAWAAAVQPRPPHDTPPSDYQDRSRPVAARA